MTNLFKWLYKLGYRHARNQILSEIERGYEFHLRQGEIADLREKEALADWDKPRMSAKQHTVAAQTLYDMLTLLDPKRFPDLGRMMDKRL